MVDQNAIKDRAQRLCNAEPQIYEQFIRLMDQYTYELMEQVCSASADGILEAKGQANQARKFMRLLTEKPTP